MTESNQTPRPSAPTPKASIPTTAKADARAVGRAISTTDEDEAPNNNFLLFNAMPSWLASFLVNTSLILILALFAYTTEKKNTVSLEASEIASVALEDASVNLEDLEFVDDETIDSDLSEAPSQQITSESEPLSIETDLLTESSNLFAGDITSFDGSDFGELSESDISNEIGGRGTNSRNQLLRKYGGNAASEAAVELALQWIADHQLPDGSWNLDHSIGPKVNDRPRTSPNPGELTNATMGATALSLLPFLGNGQTHRSGKHKKTVFDGLKFLMTNSTRRGKGLTYWDPDGEMYSHGLVAIVFAECYAMTGDEKLREFVEGTLRFIEDCQDPVGGGWRYSYREPGDTSVVGWQIMALKSGKLSGIKVNQRTFKLAKKFLDSVSTDYGAYYGYRIKPVKTDAGKFIRGNRARTAVGLLSRMYLGWEREREGLVKGVDWLAGIGPDVQQNGVINMYYNYYATQLMKHYGGDTWRTWNLAMRDFLINNQVKDDVAKGSWHFNADGQFQAAGGRLYTTVLACLTLEVYYRYLPLFQDDAIEDVFTTE